MSYHKTGSMGGYGTIDIFLENIFNLEAKEKYDYTVGAYKGFATADTVGNKLALVDNSFTYPNTPPPYDVGAEIRIHNSNTGEVILTTNIMGLNNHGAKSVFKYDTLTDSEIESSTISNIAEEVIIGDNDPPLDKETGISLIEKQSGVFTIDGAEGLYYSDGEIIQSPPLPNAYQLASTQNKCDNCEFFIEAGSYCSKWKADVRGNYWCASWSEIKTTIANLETQEDIGGNNTTTMPHPSFSEDSETGQGDDVDTPTFTNNITDDTVNMDDLEASGMEDDNQQNMTNVVDDTLPMEDDDLLEPQSPDFYVSPDIEDVGGQVDFYPTGSDGAAIIPDEKTIKRFIREKVYEGMYGSILNDETLSAEDVLSFQQTVRDGALTVGRSDDELLVYTKKDGNVLNQSGEDIERIVRRIYTDFLEAFSSMESESQLLDIIKNQISSNLQYTKSGGMGMPYVYKVIYTNIPQITEIYAIKEEGQWTNVPNIPNINFLNQFGETVDIRKAQSNLDTNIFELLPYQRSRQNEIDELFTKFTSDNFLGNIPAFDADASITNQNLAVDSGSRISETDNLNAPITRLDNQANIANENKTLQSLRNTLNLYLKDVDNIVDEIDDIRPEYQNKSEGFLKLRKPNQAIIIRNPDGGEMDFQKNDSYLTDGFTITMWVRFVGRTGNGTLFSYGNPYKEDVQSRYGFRLETFTVSKKDRYPLYPHQYRVETGDYNADGTPKYRYNASNWITKPSHDLETDNLTEFEELSEPINGFTQGRFANGDWLDPEPFAYSDYERFVRLVVWDHTDTEPYVSGSLVNDDGTYGKLYDSHFSTQRKSRQKLYNPIDSSQGQVRGEGASGRKSALPVYFPSSEYGEQGQSGALHEFAFNYTRIPTDNLDEWFFICATYDPEVDRTEEDRAKVEIISKRDLLTARGFKVEIASEEEDPPVPEDDSNETTMDFDLDDGDVDLEPDDIDLEREEPKDSEPQDAEITTRDSDAIAPESYEDPVME